MSSPGGMVSAQEFVRALKGPNDPPQLGGLSKIDLALAAWSNMTFIFPGKAEVITDWVLNTFVKDMGRESQTHPLLDVRYWRLFLSVISTHEDRTTADAARRVDHWLVPLLSHIPVARIVTNFFNLLNLVDDQNAGLLPVSGRGLAYIWSKAVQKLTSESVMECFGGFLKLWGASHKDDLLQLGLMITSSFHGTLGNLVNKKKFYITFLQNHLISWLECCQTTTGNGGHNILADAIYNVGSEILFNLDTLQQYQEQRQRPLLFSTLQAMPALYSVVFDVLPRLFASFVQSVKRHRGALSNQGSKRSPDQINTEIRVMGVDFYKACQSLLDQASQTEKSVLVRIHLLLLVDKENLYRAPQPEAEPALKKEVEVATAMFVRGRQEKSVVTINLSARCLCAITHIDFDLVHPVLGNLMCEMLLMDVYDETVFALLDMMLDYHVKTRSIDTYIRTVIEALNTDAVLKSHNPQHLYQTTLSGPLLSVQHMNRISISTNGFLTTGQALDTVTFVLESFRSLWKDFEAYLRNNSEFGRLGCLAVSVSHLAIIATIVLSSLPIQSVTESAGKQIQDLIVQSDRTVVQQILDVTLDGAYWLGNKSWPLQIVATATLRLRYALFTSRLLTYTSPVDTYAINEMMQRLRSPDILPELYFELVQILELLCQSDPSLQRKILGLCLEFIQHNFPESDTILTSQLTFSQQGKRELSLRLLHVLIQRWLAFVELNASETQLTRLVHFLLQIPLTSDRTSSQIGSSGLLLQALRSAQLWDFHNMRNVLLASINKQTKVEIKPGADTALHLTPAIVAYQLLLLCPLDYIPRSHRIGLVKRAHTIDAWIHDSHAPTSIHQTDLAQATTVLRMFITRMVSQFSQGDLQPEAIFAVLQQIWLSSQPLPPISTALTLDMVESYLRLLFKTSERQIILHVLQGFSNLEAFSLGVTTTDGYVRRQSFLRLLALLAGEFKFSQFSSDVQLVLKSLHTNWQAALAPILTTIINDDFVEDTPDILLCWHRISLLGRWLGTKLASDSKHSFGRKLIHKVLQNEASVPMPDTDSQSVGAIAMAILADELALCPDSDRRNHLDILLASYIALRRTDSLSRQEHIDAQIMQSSKDISLSDLSHILTQILDMISTDHEADNTKHALRFASLLLQEPPMGALRSIQAFMTSCLNHFAGLRLSSQHHLHLQVLAFISEFCSDKPAMLRLVDLGSIWTILSKSLAKSTIHDITTSTTVFRSIVSVITAIIRLRRDLVVYTLPHLGMSLRQLVMIMRSIRANLGAAQKRIVADSMPAWINVDYPLGGEEAKLLARLFEALATKSFVRNYASHQELQRAESLAKPFSKHASYVLRAYIDAMNDPLCILPLGIRKEFQPGLFALCSMLSDNIRDSMMISSLDAGGKTIMKALWKEYEKQRYLGKG